MPSVLLLRHASAAHGAARDHDRSLDAEGRVAAARAGAWLADHRPGVDAVLCSSAARAQETWECVRTRWERAPEAEIDEGLYMASTGALFARLQELSENVTQPLLIGHNPGLQQLGLLLAGGGESYGRLRSSLPAAALATITLPDSGWPDLQPASGELTELVTPADFRASRE
ncbi:MAG: SixA phosphatase family protein [Egibacteraceae bacterium]